MAKSCHPRRRAAEPAGELDAGNSGSTIRMLSGILAAQPFTIAHRRRRIAFAPSDGIASSRRSREMGAPDRSARREVSAAHDSRAPAARHRLHAADGQRAGEKLRAARGAVRARRHHCPRAGAHARSHRNRAAGIRRRDRSRAARDHAARPARSSPGANWWCPAICPRPLLSGRRAAAAGSQPGDPRRRAESHALRAARFSDVDGRVDQGSRCEAEPAAN